MAVAKEKWKTWLCSTCEEKNNAKYWCQDCSDGLCAACKGCHSRNKPSAHHHVVPLAEANESLLLLNKLHIRTYCEKHPREEQNMYCPFDRTFCCPTCALIYHGKCNGLQSTDQSGYTKKLKDLDLKSVSELRRQIKIQLDRERAVIQAEEEKCADQMSSLDRQTSAVKEKLDTELEDKKQQCRAGLAKVTRPRKENITNLLQLEEEIDTHTSVLESSEHFSSCQSLMARHKSLTLMQTKVGKTMLSLEKDVLELHSKLNDAMEDFLKDGQLCSISISKRKPDLGEFPAQCKNTMDTLALHLNSQGTAQVAREQKPLMSCDVAFKAEVERATVDAGNVTLDATYLPDNTMLLSDYHNYQLIKMDDKMSVMTKLPVAGKPWGICVSSYGHHVLVVCDGNKVVCYPLQGPWREVSRFRVEGDACGIAFHGDKIVTGHGHCVAVYDITGREVARVSKSGGDITYPALSHDGSKLYHRDGQNAVVCRRIENLTREVWRYSSSLLVRPHGMTIDRDGNILVVGYGSRNIHQVSGDGGHGRVVIDRLHSIVRPHGLCNNTNSDTMAVTSSRGDKVCVELYTFQD